MNFTPGWQALARLAGWGLVAVSAIFLVVIARHHWSAIAGMAISPAQWLVLAGLSAFYGFSLLLVAAGWHCVLALVGAGSPGRGHAMRAHATAQLAKYVPGNVFHLVSRHVIHRKAGMADGKLAKAAVAETLLMLSAALAVVAVGLFTGLPALLEGYRAVAVLAPLVLAGCLAAAVRWLSGGSLAHLLGAWLAYLVFFAIMGAVVAAICAMLGGAFEPGVAAGGVAAWIAGFVTPGSPGGLGVREAAMVLIDGGHVNPGTMVLTAALFRIVTFAGDLVCFALGNLLFRDSSMPGELAGC